jgi:hypothetical protein
MARDRVRLLASGSRCRDLGRFYVTSTSLLPLKSSPPVQYADADNNNEQNTRDYASSQTSSIVRLPKNRIQLGISHFTHGLSNRRRRRDDR